MRELGVCLRTESVTRGNPGLDAMQASFLMDWASTGQAIATMVAVVSAGVWAIWRVYSFREFKGFLVITQSVYYAQIADGAMHLQVIATLHNRSRVYVRPEEGFCYIEGVRQGATAESVYATAEGADGNPMTYVDSRELANAVDLEPGEDIRYQFDFMIAAEYRYLRSHVYIKDPKKRSEERWGMGWESIELVRVIAGE